MKRKSRGLYETISPAFIKQMEDAKEFFEGKK